MYAFKLYNGTQIMWNNITMYELNKVDPFSINRNSVYRNGKQISMDKLVMRVKLFLESYKCITLKSKFNLHQFMLMYKRITGVKFDYAVHAFNELKVDNNTPYTLAAWVHYITSHNVNRFELFKLYLEVIRNLRR